MRSETSSTLRWCKTPSTCCLCAKSGHFRKRPPMMKSTAKTKTAVPNQLSRRIEDSVHQGVGQRIFLAAHVAHVHVFESPQQAAHALVDRLQIRVLDAVLARELFHDELAVQAHRERSNAFVERGLKSERQRSPLRNVVGCAAQVFTDLAQHRAVRPQQHSTRSRGPRVSARTPVGKERGLYAFHRPRLSRRRGLVIPSEAAGARNARRENRPGRKKSRVRAF